ncbi:MAG: hypothetical protein QMD03_04505 [Syntrophales bacterium]|nr:hypothetical protein [Syntrophales bacterium]
MILNPFSIVMLLVASISIILGLYGSILLLKVIIAGKRYPHTSEKHTGYETGTNRVISLAAIVLALRLFSYPLFYATLQSFVKDIEGAMCIYSVTQVLPRLCGFLEIIKLLIFFSIGQWLILHFLTRQNKTAGSLTSRKLKLLLGVSIGIVAESMGELIFFLSLPAGSHIPVTCCTSKIDSPERISAILSGYLLGHQYEQPLLLFYYLSNLFLLGMIGYFLRRRRLAVRGAVRRRSVGLVFSISLMNLFLTVLALPEVIGPRLMNLPYHHCPYCLLQYVPDSFLMIALFILGTCGIGWAFGLEMITRDKETPRNLPGYLDKLYRFSFCCLSLSLAMVSIHLIGRAL